MSKICKWPAFREYASHILCSCVGLSHTQFYVNKQLISINGVALRRHVLLTCFGCGATASERCWNRSSGTILPQRRLQTVPATFALSISKLKWACPLRQPPPPCRVQTRSRQSFQKNSPDQCCWPGHPQYIESGCSISPPVLEALPLRFRNLVQG